MTLTWILVYSFGIAFILQLIAGWPCADTGNNDSDVESSSGAQDSKSKETAERPRRMPPRVAPNPYGLFEDE